MEPISTTAAATTKAAVAKTATSAATTTPSNIAAEGASSALPAKPTPATKQIDVIRELASTMIYNCEMQTLNQSEIVDEFSTPIYAGLAAATPTPSKGLSVESTQAMANASKKISASSQIPSTHQEVQELFGKYYPAPTIENQLKTDAQKIITDRTLIEDKVVTNGNGRTAICLIEEKVIDRKYLEYGHLSDVMSEIRHGNVPTMRQIYLAIIDLTDLATFKVFRSYFMKYKLEDAKVQMRQLSADLERKSLQDSLPDTSSEKYKIGRNVEERSWYKTDKVTERVGHKDTAIEKHVDLVAVNIRDVCTKEMTHAQLDKLMNDRNKLISLMGANNDVIRIERIFSPEQIASINKSAMAWVQATTTATVSEYTTDHLFHHYGVDLDGFLGEKITTSEKRNTVSEKKAFFEYLSESDNINLANINTYDDALAKFGTLKQTGALQTDAQVIARYTEPGAEAHFEEGWITYIPGGSIVNLGAKADLGCKLNGWDYFWAGVDVATIALAIVTLGASSSASAAGKAAVTGVVKAGATGAKAVAKGSAKAVGKAALKNGTKAGAKAVAKGSAKTGTKALAKMSAKQTGKAVLKNGTKAGAKAGAKTAAETTARQQIKMISRAEAKIYKDACLKKTIVNGRKCLIQPNIDWKYICRNQKINPYGWSNLERASHGWAPIDRLSKKPFQLHHVGQNPVGRLAELTHAQHMGGGNNLILHKIRENSLVNHGKLWDIERQQHWMSRAQQIISNL